jgi:NADP-dependent 3-hydroxy acid dehydrogenase YdfG
MVMTNVVEGKAAIVTGVSAGIGQTTALTLNLH